MDCHALIPNPQTEPGASCIFCFTGGFFTAEPHGKPHDKLRQRIKNRDITLLTKVHTVKAMVFPVVMNVFPDSSVGKESTCNAGDPRSIPGSGRFSGEGISYPLQYSWAFLMAQLVKTPPAVQNTWFDPWVGKIPWRRERLNSSILAWKIPWGRKESDMMERL